MSDKEKVVKVIGFWQEAARKNAVLPREIAGEIDLKSREIVDIIGPRRCGKSSLLKLLVKRLGPKDDFLFINFEDPFFIENSKPDIIDELVEVYREYFNPALKYLFFDEIQNIEQWEKAVRKLRDGGDYKIFLTGSSSKLLSRELSSLITGRHISYKLAPLTFKEYLAFKNIGIKSKKELILQGVKIVKYFKRYLALGGFPEIVLTENEELLKQYYMDILDKDIIGRYDVRQKSVLEKMGVYLLSNATKSVSMDTLEKTFGISFEMAATYLEYFKEAFLLFELPQYSYSLKAQHKAKKKIFSADTGLANSVSFRFSEDKGRVLENCVFLHLNQRKGELFYYKTKNDREVDFLVKTGQREMELIQVCYDLSEKTTRQREIRALLEAMAELKIKRGLILTEASREVVKIGGSVIKVMPVYEWLMEEE